jgi:hypothetical protein
VTQAHKGEEASNPIIVIQIRGSWLTIPWQQATGERKDRHRVLLEGPQSIKMMVMHNNLNRCPKVIIISKDNG